MAETTHIEWTDATWNPITGCSVVSPGCTNCYAMKLAGTRLRHHPSRQGLTQMTKAGPVWTGDVRFNREWLDQPLRWKRPRRIFVCAHGDLFHEAVPDDVIDQVFAVMALAPQHTFQVLTKRADRMRGYMTAPERAARLADAVMRATQEEPLQVHQLGRAWLPPKGKAWGVTRAVQGMQASVNPWPLPNVWLGVSAEDEPRAEDRVPQLLRTPAAVRFISYEPALGPLNGRRWLPAGLPAKRPDGTAFLAPHWYMAECHKCGWMGSSELCRDDEDDVYCPECYASGVDDRDAKIDWVIVGGESGPGARPMHPDWARQIRDACAAAGVAFFFKQWGDWAPAPEHFQRLTIAHGSEPPNVAWPDGSIAWGNADQHGGAGVALTHLGKARAGRLLDGVEHSAMPEAAP